MSDISDPTSYRLVSLNDEPGTVRIVNKPQPRGIVINNRGSADEDYDQNLPSAKTLNNISGENSGKKVFINNQGQQIFSKSEHRGGGGGGGGLADPSNVSSPGSGKVHSPTVPVGGKFGDQGDFKNPRDDARRKQHNEVERRRRDKINTWIARLAKIVPECSDEAKSSQSKGGIQKRSSLLSDWRVGVGFA